MRPLLLALLLVTPGLAGAAPSLYWPVANSSAPVCAYVDDQGKDWKCGTNFYAGHRGTDISVGTGTAVLAGAPGTVNHRVDGCPVGAVGNYCGAGFGNHISLWHGNGDETIYGHLTASSGLPADGAQVSCGERLGNSGSSGNSSGPHLHFEVRLGVNQASYYSGYPDDPFQGPCGGPLSYWVAQGTGYSSSCGMAADQARSASSCGCPAGTYALWTCNAQLTSRARCRNNQVETEQCPGGCEARPTGTDDVCKPTSTCPAGTYPIWTCDTQLTSRTRCVNGQVATEPCPNGCKQNPVGTDDVCNAAPTCPSGTFPIWTCDAQLTSRTRCVNAKVETEQCASGCETRPTGTDDVCKSGCPSGTFALWTCDAQLGNRTRCVNGVVETEACPGGCEARPTGTDDVCKAPTCPQGTFPVWTCDAQKANRVRCQNGVVENEACAYGCQENPVGTDDVCHTKPPPPCPTGLGPAWTCSADKLSRNRCLNGTVQTEGCPQGCLDGSGGADATCQAPPTCPQGTYPLWTCSADRKERVRCQAGMVEREACRNGCTVFPVGVDDQCAAPSCPGASPIWTCSADKASRSRCVSGQVVTEPCPDGCEEKPTGTDDVCKPPVTCPAGLGQAWTCNPTGSARRHCVGGLVVEEQCPAGCEEPPGQEAACRPSPGCPAGLGPEWICQKDQTGRTRCLDGMVEVEACATSCIQDAGQPAACAEPCPAGLGPTWACNEEGSARRRCEQGRVMSESCPGGCVETTVGDPICGEGCPEGSFGHWTCSADGKQRSRCLNGRFSQETCSGGCKPSAPGADDLCTTPAAPNVPSGGCGCGASSGPLPLLTLLILAWLRRRPGAPVKST